MSKIKWNEENEVSRMVSIVVFFGVFYMGFFLGTSYGNAIIEALTSELHIIATTVVHIPAKPAAQMPMHK